MKNTIMFMLILGAFGFGIYSFINFYSLTTYTNIGGTPLSIYTTETIVWNLTYNHTDIEKQVINEAKEYFQFIDGDATIELKNASIWKSGYAGSKKTIYIGIEGIENNPELFKMVLTHEYAHYVYDRLGLTNDPLHEGLADAYTWRTNKNEQEKRWGKNDEKRVYPYTVITHSINKYSCLELVFTKSEKIVSIKDLIDRLEDKCEVDFTTLVNQL
jgi:hypothetical protein